MRLWHFQMPLETVPVLADLLANHAGAESAVLRPEWGECRIETILAGRATAGSPLVTHERLLLFEDFPQADICRFIDAYHLRRLPEPIWAAVTPVSRSWRFVELLRELVRERESLRRQPPDPELT